MLEVFRFRLLLVRSPQTPAHRRHARAQTLGSTIARLECAGQSLLDLASLKKLAELAKHLEQPDQVYAMARLNANRTTLADFQSWVPASFLANQDYPESVTTSLGRPWIWMAKPGAWMSDPVAFRQVAIGQFMFGLGGQSLLLLFPVQSFVELNIDVCQAGSRIRSMSVQELERFMLGSGVRHFTLSARTAVWVPYGWVPMCIAVLASGESLATHAILPFVNSDYVWQCRSLMRAVLSSLEAYESGLEGKQAETVDKDHEAVRLWLSEALEGDDADRDAQLARDTAAAASSAAGVSANVQAVRVIEPPPRKKQRTGQRVAAGANRRQPVSQAASVPTPPQAPVEERKSVGAGSESDSSSSDGDADAEGTAGAASAK